VVLQLQQILGGARIAAASSFATRGASSTARSCDGKSVELRAWWWAAATSVLAGRVAHFEDLTLLLVHIDLLLVVQNISPSFGRLLGTVVCSSTESSDHTGKNEKVVIPMHQEAWQDILQMHEMVPNYITWFLREQSFCIIPSCCCTFNLLADDFNPATGVLPVRIHLCTIFWTIVWSFWWEIRSTTVHKKIYIWFPLGFV
jgi:hypothetical protein